MNARPRIAFHLLLATLLLSVFAPAAQAYYSPSTGRFTSRDPLVTQPRFGAALRSLPLQQQARAATQLYEYVASNPMRYADPMGLHPDVPDREWGPWRDPILDRPDLQGPPQPSIPSRGNCYRFACNDPGQPGQPHSPFPGGKDPGGVITCKQVKDGAIKDGMTEPDKCSGECPAGSRKVAYGITPPQGPNKDWNDYHWWRQQPDGTWKHKPGQRPVRDRDWDGNPITDPSKSNRGPYTTFCGYLCAPDGMDVDP